MRRSGLRSLYMASGGAHYPAKRHSKNSRHNQHRRGQMWRSVFAFFVGAALGPGLAFAQATPPGIIAQEQAPLARGRIVAVGIPQASAIAEVGVFHPGGPIHDKPEFAEYTKPGNILDPKRILVTSTSNFGA